MQDLEGVGGERLLLAGGADASHRPHEADLAEVVGPGHRVLEQAHRGKQRQVLERPGDSEPGNTVRADLEQILPVELQPATGGVVDPADHVEHRRLARAVRADQSEDLTLVDAERQSVERDDATEGHRDLINFEQCHQSSSPRPLRSRSRNRSSGAPAVIAVGDVASGDMHRGRLLTLAIAGVVTLSACAGAVEVTSERADPIAPPIADDRVDVHDRPTIPSIDDPADPIRSSTVAAADEHRHRS